MGLGLQWDNCDTIFLARGGPCGFILEVGLNQIYISYTLRIGMLCVALKFEL